MSNEFWRNSFIVFMVLFIFTSIAWKLQESPDKAYERGYAEGKSDAFAAWVYWDDLRIWHMGFHDPPWPMDTTFVNKVLANEIDTFYLMTALYSHPDSVLIDIWGEIIVIGIPDPTDTLPAVEYTHPDSMDTMPVNRGQGGAW